MAITSWIVNWEPEYKVTGYANWTVLYENTKVYIHYVPSISKTREYAKVRSIYKHPVYGNERKMHHPNDPVVRIDMFLICHVHVDGQFRHTNGRYI